MRFEKQKFEARRRYLNHLDVVEFRNVPAFIINAFFDQGSYHKRLIVTTFGFLNGINYYNLSRMIKWTNKTQQDMRKVEDLLENYLVKPEYQKKYYSYSVIRDCVLFLDGALRLYGRRVEN